MYVSDLGGAVKPICICIICIYIYIYIYIYIHIHIWVDLMHRSSWRIVFVDFLDGWKTTKSGGDNNGLIYHTTTTTTTTTTTNDNNNNNMRIMIMIMIMINNDTMGNQHITIMWVARLPSWPPRREVALSNRSEKLILVLIRIIALLYDDTNDNDTSNETTTNNS